MKRHKNVTASHHASSSPSLDVLVTLVCMATKSLKQQQGSCFTLFIFFISMRALILCDHMVAIQSHMPYPLLL